MTMQGCNGVRQNEKMGGHLVSSSVATDRRKMFGCAVPPGEDSHCFTVCGKLKQGWAKGGFLTPFLRCARPLPYRYDLSAQSVCICSFGSIFERSGGCHW